MKFLIGVLLGLAAVAVMAVFSVHRWVQDHTVPLLDSLVTPELQKRAMAIFPHPDDEIAVGGTLAMLRQQGVETALLMLTRGGAAKPTKDCSAADMLRLRPQEVRRSARALGVGDLAQLDFPDGGLANLPPERSQELKAAVLAAIERFKPSVVITYDQQVGMYGHNDHTTTARLISELVEEHRGRADFPVKIVYAVTLPARQITLAKRFSEVFRTRYPAEPDRGLPAPQHAVRITSCGRAKSAAIRAHFTQRKSLQELNPFHEKLPSWLYWRILDREYFTIAVDLRSGR